MTTHSSAIAHQDTPHETETTIITVSDATKRRAESVINDKNDRSAVANHYSCRFGIK